ncbi:MAG: sporulation protein YqfD [Firmicutes bacterium]|nr:sporulation protein YqfD [Bacillota bacterium]
MLVIRLWNYLRGYVIIKVEGLTLERFINLAITKDIYLWDIYRHDYTTLEAKVSIKGFKALRNVMKKVGCRSNIIEKKGFPFLIHRFKYRKMLAFGFIVSLGIIFFLTSFIWTVDIVSNGEIREDYLLEFLKKNNVKPGIKKNEVKINNIERMLLESMDTLSYVHADIVGTKLLIEVKKRDEIPKRVNKNIPCNIIADKKAVIEKVIAKNGKAEVEKGDIVKKGQILISGVLKDERMENPLLVHSEGDILARTYYKKIIKEPIVKTIKEETGKKFVTKETKIGDKRIHMIDGDIPFKHYKEIITNKKVFDSKVVDIPIEIIKHEYREVNLKKVTRNVDSLKKISSIEGTKILMEELPKGIKVISKDVRYSIEDNILTTTINIEVIEEIGKKEEIKYNYNKED